MPPLALLLQYTADASAGNSLTVVVFLALLVATAAAMWRVFALAGQPGWAAIVPVYNGVVLMRVAGRSGWWAVLLFVPLVNLVVALVAAVGVARRFGHGVGFALGLWLLPFVFYPILALDDERPTVRAVA